MISVAIATYNGEKFLEKQLQSIFDQSMPVDEVVVCDDCSTDHTLEILKKYPVSIYKNNKTLGFKLNFHKAISLCKGDYIFLCDQDDIWEKEKVEKLIKIMKENSKVHVCTSAFVYIDADNKLLSTKNSISLYPTQCKPNSLNEIMLDSILSINYFQGSSLVMDKWTKDIFISKYDSRIEHDWFICLIASSYDGLYFYNSPLFKYRIHENNEIGIAGLGDGLKEHISNSDALDVRKEQAEKALIVLEILKKINSTYYESRKEYFDNLLLFCKKHIVCLENNDFLGLFKQNFSKYYCVIATKKARLMDLFFVIFNKGK